MLIRKIYNYMQKYFTKTLLTITKCSYFIKSQQML
jgi:hypothetical protein